MTEISNKLDDRSPTNAHDDGLEMKVQMRRQQTIVERDGNSSFSSIHGAPKPSSMTMRSEMGTAHDRSRKLGHRRVNEAGEVTYKKKPTSELMAAIQLGIGQSITSLAGKPKRDLLLQDFSIVETVYFPKEGSSSTPAHEYTDFRFRTYASVAFRYFRELFGIQPDDFLVSLCNSPLREVTNPGASGSIFYISNDDEFIIKTVQHKEADFLQKLLPGYYMNQNQNPRTLLPKFYGLYCYQCGNKNIRFIVMNNLMPSSIRMHEKYDLKGSTYKRKASRSERAKSSPTLKDLDFIELHGDGGLMLEAETYSALLKTIERDCRVLQSFQIMDYSMLLCVHNLDQAYKDRESREIEIESPSSPRASNAAESLTGGVTRGRSFHQRLAQFSTTMEAIQAKTEPLEIDETHIPPGGIPARSYRGERLLLYLGIIDILQSYRIGKKLEHALKSIVHDGDTISVHRPGFYAQRFQTFCGSTVFKKVPSLDQPQVKGPHVRFKKLVQIAMKQSPASRKPFGEGGEGNNGDGNKKFGDGETGGAVGGRPDILPSATPPPELNVTPSRTAMSTPTHTSFTEGTPSYTPSTSSCYSTDNDNRGGSGRVSGRSTDLNAERLVMELAASGSVAMDNLSSRLSESLGEKQ